MQQAVPVESSRSPFCGTLTTFGSYRILDAGRPHKPHQAYFNHADAARLMRVDRVSLYSRLRGARRVSRTNRNGSYAVRSNCRARSIGQNSYAAARRAKSSLPEEFSQAVSGLMEDFGAALGIGFEGDEGEEFFRSSLIQTVYYGLFAGGFCGHGHRTATNSDGAVFRPISASHLWENSSTKSNIPLALRNWDSYRI